MKKEWLGNTLAFLLSSLLFPFRDPQNIPLKWVVDAFVMGGLRVQVPLFGLGNQQEELCFDRLLKSSPKKPSQLAA